MYIFHFLLLCTSEPAFPGVQFSFFSSLHPLPTIKTTCLQNTSFASTSHTFHHISHTMQIQIKKSWILLKHSKKAPHGSDEQKAPQVLRVTSEPYRAFISSIYELLLYLHCTNYFFIYISLTSKWSHNDMLPGTYPRRTYVLHHNHGQGRFRGHELRMLVCRRCKS